MKQFSWMILVAVAFTAACDLEIDDLNNPGLDELTENPTPLLISAAATGLVIGNRTGYADDDGYISVLGILGRESYTFSDSEPRFITELLAGPSLDPGNPRFGGNFWAAPYRNINNAFVLLGALDNVEGLSEAEREATRGFAKTIQALDYLVVINTHDENRAAVVTADSSPDNLPALVSKGEIFAEIVRLLDEADTHLANGGDAFPFQLGAGFNRDPIDDGDNFDRPGTFRTFNRALKARVEIYRGEHRAALDALAQSFLTADPEQPKLERGVYHAYSTNPGDAVNGLNSTGILAHPSVRADAEVIPGGDSLDRRAETKLKVLATPVSNPDEGLSSNLIYTMYASNSAFAPIIRNEELILLRAEANIALENFTEARADLDFVRAQSGGLDVSRLPDEQLVDELLKQRRYSLLFEGHYWIDMRRYGRLDQLPLDREKDVVHSAFPIPAAESGPRP
ncbi:MAG: RagB/SusD family nutrient uptake outer membrane protein [Proteobacteria bacterium]|nr:RagB/SusD family nutrient uptake outer membrane protein [Pseudomonadota bacterium]